MQLSKTELKTISELGNGNQSVQGIAKALNISQSQVYRIAKNLSKKGILNLSDSTLQSEVKTHISMLLKLLAKAVNLSDPLSGTGIKIYATLTEPKTVAEISKQTGLHKTTVLKKINQGRKMSLLRIENRTYRINELIWPDAKEFFQEFKKYDNAIDPRAPINSIIYYKNEKEIVFSNKEELNAEKTAFSVYQKYGIGLLLITNYYYLPRRNLTITDIFRHTLYIIESEFDIRHIIFLALFYLKHRTSLPKIKNPILENLDKIFKGEKVTGYPTLAEIRSRAEVYNIKV